MAGAEPAALPFGYAPTDPGANFGSDRARQQAPNESSVTGAPSPAAVSAPAKLRARRRRSPAASLRRQARRDAASPRGFGEPRGERARGEARPRAAPARSRRTRRAPSAAGRQRP